MAVAQILEKRINTQDRYEASANSNISADRCHNAKIRENYARLINSDNAIRETMPERVVVRGTAQTAVQKPNNLERERAQSILFGRQSNVETKDESFKQSTPDEEKTKAEEIDEDEDNEALRPTQETLKYKKNVASKIVLETEGKAARTVKGIASVSKRAKIIIAAVVVAIATLFALIIVNSAVLANLKNEVNSLQNDLTIVQTTHDEVSQLKAEYFENVEQTVNEFAQKKGMVKVGR